MTPTYSETYVVSMAFVDKLPEPAPRLAEQLQPAYDESVAGFFNWERMGRVTVLHLERQIAEDEEVLDGKGLAMTPNTVIAQLIVEFLEARASIPEGERDDQYNLLTTIITALESCEGVKVDGLPCQCPAATLTVRMAFPTKAARHAALHSGSLDDLVEMICSKLDADKLKIFFEESDDGQA